MCLTDKPNTQFRAFQAANEKRLTLIQGNALSEKYLSQSQAGVALSHMLLADAFTADPAAEDTSILFQVGALNARPLTRWNDSSPTHACSIHPKGSFNRTFRRSSSSRHEG